MAKIRHLTSAPIAEALIDFRVNLPSEFNAETFSNINDDFTSRYPHKVPLMMRSGKIEFKIENGKTVVNHPVDKEVQGYIYKSTDGKDVAQFRMDGFTFSRLSPYTSWEKIFLEASSIWELYCSKSSPDMITRIAVRYINKLDIPGSLNDLGEYLVAPLKIPEGLPEQVMPQQVTQFLTRAVIQEANLTANIIQALDKSPKPDHIGVILDIDVYKASKKGFDRSTVLSEFEALRELKNRIFFNSITEKMARLCE